MVNPIRSELETRLKTYADSKSPRLPVAYEGVLFKKPTTSFLECFMVASDTRNPTTDGLRKRQRGIFKVNVWCPVGKGTGEIDTIAQEIIDAFPIVPKTGNVSVEQTPNAGDVIPDVAGWLVLPVDISYRYES